MRKPDFFIVGAPKSGTTAMYKYLKQHPEIFMPEKKEIHFFGSDLNFKRNRYTMEQYLAFFSKVEDEKRVGEASVWYLYSKRAAFEINEFNPTASIIIMLRNPVEMLYSLHNQLLFNSIEDIVDFKVALEAESDRKKGLNIPNSAHLVYALFYRETVKYTHQVQRYFSVFGRERVHIIIYDDFKKDIAAVYRETLRFLEVKEDFKPIFEVVNPNKQVKNYTFQRFLHNPPQIARRISRILIPTILRQSIVDNLVRLNTYFKPRLPIDPLLKKQLQAEFKLEIERLSELLGRDLTFWSR